MTDEHTSAGTRLAVIGAGTMGHGIAQVAAVAGYDVRLHDVSEEVLKAALERVRANLDRGVELGKVERGARDAALHRLTVTTDLAAAVGGAEIVVEAVPEKMALMREVTVVLAIKAAHEGSPSGESRIG